MKKCINCKYARIAITDRKCEEYVACSKQGSLHGAKRKDILDYIEKIDFKGKLIGHGYCLIDKHPSDEIDNPNNKEEYLMGNCYLIMSKDSYCNKFEPIHENNLN